MAPDSVLHAVAEGICGFAPHPAAITAIAPARVLHAVAKGICAARPGVGKFDWPGSPDTHHVRIGH